MDIEEKKRSKSNTKSRIKKEEDDLSDLIENNDYDYEDDFIEDDRSKKNKNKKKNENGDFHQEIEDDIKTGEVI